MSPHILPGFRLLPGMALSIGGTPGRVTLGSGGVLLWLAEGGGPGYIAGIDRMLPTMEDVALVADDPATGGCLVALLGSSARDAQYDAIGKTWGAWIPRDGWRKGHPTLGAACVAVATALGRWLG